jgi:photosystem II stability/assembly factor-like uncharacterized protein
MKRSLVIALVFLLVLTPAVWAKADKSAEDEKSGPMSSKTFSGLSLRCLGPAGTEGRVGDFAVNPERPWEYYAAVCSGNVWKTMNGGTTWTPIFDDQGSYSIGCITLDPNDPLTVWVGTGENNSQRSVSYGDGVYKSVDGGKTWKNMGLKESEHIGMIAVDPRNSAVVYVAAQGPLWNPGGDRGLYKTVDGGDTWDLVLEISADTGVNEVHLDPRNPDVIYASSYQRRRHVWTLIDGGPESAIYKSTDAGATWNKLTNGVPKVDMGRIGLAVSPVDPDVVYAIIEAAVDKGGFFRSTDAGATWEKRSDYETTSAQYYNEIFADPKNVDRVYAVNTFLSVTQDGGKTFERVGLRTKHVDDHAVWIDPSNTDHLLVGCDGGIYETYDRGETWNFKANLPITQFYRVCVDYDSPFYSVYGGTQDNNSLGAPTRTISSSGITNDDWTITLGGDGYESQVDPTNPDIVYSEYQYGGLARYDKRTGEALAIQPQPGPGEPPIRWNWDSPLLLSPHSPTRLYFAGNILFRTDDRGDSWKAVSPDLTRQIDRNKLEVMGVLQSVDAVAKNNSTSFYGNCVSLTESPIQEGLIYVGTDDGLIQVTEDGGKNWRKIEKVKGVPEMTYVSELTASRHEAGTVFAAFDNHKKGDFKPYVFKSTDMGRSWSSITGDLPERGTVYAVEQDHVDPNLLFAGTEFGLFFTYDGGSHWIQLKGGFPVIAVRDLDVQRRENDLAVATFGRGIYILDDYTPLRFLTPDRLESEAVLFPVKKTYLYYDSTPLGGRGKANRGDNFYVAENPPNGAVFTYYLKETLETRKEMRREEEKKRREAGERIKYPSWDELRLEDREQDPVIIFTIKDADGNVVRRITGPVTKGIHRVAWDMKYPSSAPASTTPWVRRNPWSMAPRGPMAAPGTYSVSMAKRVEGVTTPIGEAQRFEAAPLGLATLPAENWGELLAFQKKTAALQRAVLGAIRTADDAQSRIDHIQAALRDTPGADPSWLDEARALELRLADLRIPLQGDRTISSRDEPTPPSIRGRVMGIIEGSWESTSSPTKTNMDSYEVAKESFEPVLESLTKLVEVDLKALETKLESAGAPYTPGRIPEMKK